MQAKQPKGCMNLRNATVNSVDHGKRTHVFEINSPSSKNKVLYVQAKNAPELQDWTDAITKNARAHGSVSAPMAVQHKVHGGFDGEKGFTVRRFDTLHATWPLTILHPPMYPRDCPTNGWLCFAQLALILTSLTNTRVRPSRLLSSTRT